MTVNRKVTGTAVTMPMGIGIGCGISLMLTLLGAGVIAKLISAEILQETSIGYSAMMILLISSAAGAAVAIRKVQKRMLQVSLLVGVIYYGMLLASTAIFFGGHYQGMGVTGLLVVAGCAAVILMENRDKKRIRFRKGRRRS